MSNKITQDQLKKVLDYDPETGVFMWIVSRKGVNAGGVAGIIVKDSGYRKIGIDGYKYRASRLAWLYMEGYFPEYTIDHINRIRHDDRWENLRHASQQCNVRNSNMMSNNTSGITGVSWYKRLQKWRVDIMVSGKNIFLGYFLYKTDAVRARWKAEVKHDFPNCNTTSSAYQYLQRKEVIALLVRSSEGVF